MREKSSISRLWAQMWLGMWSLIPLLSFCGTLFDSEGDWAAYFQGLWFMLLPPIGIVLFLGLAIWVSMWRTVTICHERGLSHRGWFAPRFVDWDDIEEVGSAIFWDWVRAHDGRTIRMTFPARPEVGKAREELRAEIMRRAPGAKGGWKAKD